MRMLPGRGEEYVACALLGAGPLDREGLRDGHDGTHLRVTGASFRRLAYDSRLWGGCLQQGDNPRVPYARLGLQAPQSGSGGVGEVEQQLL